MNLSIVFLTLGLSTLLSSGFNGSNSAVFSLKASLRYLKSSKTGLDSRSYRSFRVNFTSSFDFFRESEFLKLKFSSFIPEAGEEELTVKLPCLEPLEFGFITELM